MDFVTLHEIIPYVSTGQQHILTMSPYEGITLRMPGRHAFDTDPEGGDFVIEVTDPEMNWVNHQFTHDDIFKDVQEKTNAPKFPSEGFMAAYAAIVMGGQDPERHRFMKLDCPGIDPNLFLRAAQCLAVAEHRRYHAHERNGGGRYLPARFSAGIVQGIWTADDVKAYQRRGRQGLENLIKEKGRPRPLKSLYS